jgi:hypothetical protein
MEGAAAHLLDTALFAPLHLYSAPLHLVLTYMRYGIVKGSEAPYRTFGYAGLWIWTSENSSSTHFGE